MANDVNGLVGPPKTRDYRPSFFFGGGLFGFGNQQFHNRDVESMRRDAQVSLCIGYRKAPVHTAEFDYAANSPAVKKFIEETTKRFWRKSLPVALESVDYGYCGSEALYKLDSSGPSFDKLKPLLPWDVRPYTKAGQLDSVRVMSAGSRGQQGKQRSQGLVELKAATPKVPAKGVWFVHNQSSGMYNQWFGLSEYAPAWNPWRWKTMPDGAQDIIGKWYYRFAYSGMTIKHPNTSYRDPTTGAEIPAQDYARQIGEWAKTGANFTLPSDTDGDGHALWEIVNYAKVEGDGGKNVIDYVNAYLDVQIQRGLNIPDELITHQGNTGGYSRSQISLTAFLVYCEQILHAILEAFVDQILRPLVFLRFGPRAKFTVTPKPLVPPDQEAAKSAGAANPMAGLMGGQQGQGQQQQQTTATPDQGAPQGGDSLQALLGGATGGDDTVQMSHSRTFQMSWRPEMSAAGHIKAIGTAQHEGKVLYGKAAIDALHDQHNAAEAANPSTANDRGGETGDYHDGNDAGDEMDLDAQIREWEAEHPETGGGKEEAPDIDEMFATDEELEAVAEWMKPMSLPSPDRMQRMLGGLKAKRDQGKPIGPVEAKDIAIVRKGVMSKLSDVGKAALAKGSQVEHAIGKFVEKLPPAIRYPVVGAYKTYFATYQAGQKAARAVAVKVGGEEHADRVGRIIAVVDLLGAKGNIVTAASAGVTGGAALAAGFVPIGSMAYLAYGGSVLALRKAKKLLDSLRGSGRAQPAMQMSVGEKTRDQIKTLLGQFQQSQDPDWHEAVVMAAMDDGHNLYQAIKLANGVLEKYPTKPGGDGESQDEAADEAVQMSQAHGEPGRYVSFYAALQQELRGAVSHANAA